MAFNWLAILVSLIFTMVLGMLWYGPLFGKTWMRWMGIKKQPDKSEGGKAILASVASNALMLIALAFIIDLLGATDWASGAAYGLLLWTLPTLASTSTIWFENKDKRVWALYAANTLVVFVVSGAILGAW